MEQIESAERPQPSKSQYLEGWRLATVILSLYLGAFVMALDTNIINVAVPKITSDFHALEDVAWYGSAYLLTATSFQPAFGTLYKFFNIVNTYKGCLVTFEIGSILCAAARNSAMFICGRAVAGLGAAGILQGALAVIGEVVEMEKRPLYQSIVISVYVVTVCIGPALGGAFTTHSTWRWCFWINVPFGAIVLILLYFFLRINDADNQTRKLPLSVKLGHMDPLGCTAFIAAICCLLIALQRGGQSESWGSATVIGLFVGFGLLILVFFQIQTKLGEKATIPLRVLRSRSILAGSGVLFFLGATLYVISFYLPFWFQTVEGVDAITSGVRFIPLLVPQILALIVTGAVVSKWGYYIPYMLIGELVCVGGISLLTRLVPTSSTLFWASSLVVTGIGMGMAMQLPYTAVQVALNQDDVSTGNGKPPTIFTTSANFAAITVFFSQLGGAISIVVGQTVTLSTIKNAARREFPESMASTIVVADPTRLSEAAMAPKDLDIMRSIWNTAVIRTMFLALAMACMAIPCTLCMEWLNTRKVADKRKARLDDRELEESKAISAG